jgi:hypothetical protein
MVKLQEPCGKHVAVMSSLASNSCFEFQLAQLTPGVHTALIAESSGALNNTCSTREYGHSLQLLRDAHEHDVNFTLFHVAN